MNFSAHYTSADANLPEFDQVGCIRDETGDSVVWTIQEVGALGEFLAVFGVFVSLVFLGLQTRRNAQQLQAQSRTNILGGLTEVTVQLSDEATYDFVWDLAQSGQLTPKQLGRLRLLFTGWQCRHEMLFYDIKDGILPKSHEQILRYRLFCVFEISEVMPSLWESDVRLYFSEDFQAYVDDQLQGGLLDEFPASVYTQGATAAPSL